MLECGFHAVDFLAANPELRRDVTPSAGGARDVSCDRARAGVRSKYSVTSIARSIAIGVDSTRGWTSTGTGLRSYAGESRQPDPPLYKKP